MHNSIRLNSPIELINITPLNPLVSKCQIKVCYVGEDPNRNRSIITKETAKQLANSIPGSPIVGFFNTTTGDYEEHNRVIDISGGKYEVKDTTRPYGFVSMDAKVWFEKFADDGIEHEYLMTEGYLWTGQYPECQRVIERGNNQSMELDQKNLDGYWTKDGNGKPEFFIINEAIMSKLCILGEDVEPCFEGASISKIEFSFEDSFKEQLFSLIKQIQENINEGGTPMFNKCDVKVGDSLWTALYSNIDYEAYSIDGVYEEGEQKFAVLQNRTENKFYRMNFSFVEDNFSSEELTEMTEYAQNEEAQFAAVDVEAFESEFKKKKEDEKEENKDKAKEGEKPEDEKEPNKKGSFPPKADDKKDDEEEEDEDKEKNKKKKKNYNLEEIEEYNQLKSDYEALKSEVESLRQFKLSIEKVEKQKMIDSFYMLDDEDKKDVIDNINTYSLDDIEAKLSVICVRKKVSFTADEDNNDKKDPLVYNLDDTEDDSVPAWIKAVMETAKTLSK